MRSPRTNLLLNEAGPLFQFVDALAQRHEFEICVGHGSGNRERGKHLNFVGIEVVACTMRAIKRDRP